MRKETLTNLMEKRYLVTYIDESGVPDVIGFYETEEEARNKIKEDFRSMYEEDYDDFESLDPTYIGIYLEDICMIGKQFDYAEYYISGDTHRWDIHDLSTFL